VIPKALTPKYINSNLKSYHLKLTDKNINIIDNLSIQDNRIVDPDFGEFNL